MEGSGPLLLSCLSLLISCLFYHLLSHKTNNTQGCLLLVESLWSPPPFSTSFFLLTLLFCNTFNLIFSLFLSAFSLFLVSSGPALPAFSLFFSPPSCRWMTFPVIAALVPSQHPVATSCKASAISCVADWSANSEFFPRALIRFLLSS